MTGPLLACLRALAKQHLNKALVGKQSAFAAPMRLCQLSGSR